MPFLSQTDKRQRFQQFTPAEQEVDPTFGDVFGAGVGQVIDEEMSISYLLNNEARNARKSETKKLADAGSIDLEKYTNYMGEIDYDRIARETGLIKTDREVYDQRNELLKKRREYREDVFERGSGMAQFFGMATGYMLDPINITTMPIATSSSTVKGMSVLGRAMTVARNEAAVAASAELLIQPLVYQHKHDINSPYSATDALTAIATAATGGAILGGIGGGLAGYLKKVREKSAPFVPEQPDVEQPFVRQPDKPAYSPELQAYETLARIEEDLKMAKISTSYSLVADQYAKFKQGEIDSVVNLNKATVKELETRSANLLKSNRETYGRFIAGKGGLNAKAWAAEGFDLPDLKDIKGDFGKPFVRKNGGMTPDDLAEVLTEMQSQGYPIRVDGDANKALDFISDLIQRGDRRINADVQAELDNIEKQLDMIAKGSEQEVLEKVYGQAVKADIDNDIEWLREYESRLAESSEPMKTPDMYLEPPRMDAEPQTLGFRERDVLERNGLAKDYDYDIAEYKQLVDDGTPVLNFDGENVVDAKAIIDGYDREIEGLNSVLECALG